MALAEHLEKVPEDIKEEYLLYKPSCKGSLVAFQSKQEREDARKSKISKTKLAKLLYLADFAWYYDHLESMSGMQYRKITHGPVPDSFFRAIDELEESGKIVIERKNDDGKEMMLIREADSNKNEKINT